MHPNRTWHCWNFTPNRTGTENSYAHDDRSGWLRAGNALEQCRAVSYLHWWLNMSILIMNDPATCFTTTLTLQWAASRPVMVGWLLQGPHQPGSWSAALLTSCVVNWPCVAEKCGGLAISYRNWTSEIFRIILMSGGWKRGTTPSGFTCIDQFNFKQ